MSQATHRFALSIVALLLLAMLAAPSFSDVLVMTDGTELVIDGPWRDKGRVIQFTLPNGTLSSVRASEVDLEASVEATRLAKQPPAAVQDEAPKEKPKPIAVWTNDDIPQASPDVLAGQTAAVDAQAVQVTNWQAEPGTDANIVTVIRGTLQNYGNNIISGLSLSVTVTGSRPTGTNPSLVRQARLDANSLSPGETTTFSVEIRRGDVVSVGTVEEFQSPSASFQVLFESNPQDEDGSDSESDNESDDDSSDEGRNDA